MKKRVVVALGGNALGNSLPEQKIAVKSTAKTIIDLVEADCDVVVRNCLMHFPLMLLQLSFSCYAS